MIIATICSGGVFTERHQRSLKPRPDKYREIQGVARPGGPNDQGDDLDSLDGHLGSFGPK